MASESEASCVSDPNFAVICSFLECFGKSCGLDYPDISRLQEMLDNVQEVPQSLIDLHIKLLRKLRKSVAPEKWERALVKFCHSYSNQDGWELERFGYKKARVAVKLRLLKALLEAQFDLNQRFKNEINKLSAKELRVEPLGRDKTGLAYWCQLDDKCNIRVYREDLDEENWELVAKDREGMIGLISVLSDGEVGALPLSEDSNGAESIDQPTIDTGQDEAMDDEESADETNNDTQTKPKKKLANQDEEEADDEEESGEDDDEDDEESDEEESESEEEAKEGEQIKKELTPSEDGKLKEKLDIKEPSKEEPSKQESKPEDQSAVKSELNDKNGVTEKVKPIETSVITTPTKLAKLETPTKTEPAEPTISPTHNKLPIKPIDQLAANLVRIQSEKLEKQPKSLENIAKNLAKSSQLAGSRNGLDLSSCARYDNEQPVDFSGMDLSSRSKTESIDLSAGYRTQDKEMDLSTKKTPSKAEIGYDPRAVMMRNHAMVADLSKRQAPFAGFDMSAGYHNSGRLPKEEHRLPSYSILPDPSKIAALRMGSSPIKRPLDEGAPMIKRLRSDGLPIRPIDKKDWRAEVSEPIEEPLMMVQGEGQGQDCESVNPEFGEAVEEPVMFFFGEGSGRDCDAGNPGDDEGENKESDSKTESKKMPDSSLVNNVAKTVQLNKDVDTTDHCSVSSETVELSKPKFKPSLGVQVIAKSNQGVKRISRWDVGKPDEKQSGVSSQADISDCKPGVPEIATNCADKLSKISRDDCTSLSDNQKESDGSASPPRFFFGPNCISYTPKFEKPFDKRPEPTESKTKESTDVDKRSTNSAVEEEVAPPEPSSVAVTKGSEITDVAVEKEAPVDLKEENEDQSNKLMETCETETSNLPESKDNVPEAVDEVQKKIETSLELEPPTKVEESETPMEVECDKETSEKKENESEKLQEDQTEPVQGAEKCESTEVPEEESRTEVEPKSINSTVESILSEKVTENLENDLEEPVEEKNNSKSVEEQNEDEGKSEPKYMELTENNLKACNKGFNTEILSGNTSLVANYASSESNVSDDVFMNDRDGEFTTESKMSDIPNETESLKSNCDDSEIDVLPEYRCNSENELQKEKNNIEREKISLENNDQSLESNEISQTEELSSDVSSFQISSDVALEKPELQENSLDTNVLRDQIMQDHKKEELPVQEELPSLSVQKEIEKEPESLPVQKEIEREPELLLSDKLDDEIEPTPSTMQNEVLEKPVEESTSLPAVEISETVTQKEPEVQSQSIIEQPDVQKEEKFEIQEPLEKKVPEVQQVDDKIEDEKAVTVEPEIKSDLEQVVSATEEKQVLQNEVVENITELEKKNEISKLEEIKSTESTEVQPTEVQPTEVQPIEVQPTEVSSVDEKQDEPTLTTFSKPDEPVSIEVTKQVEVPEPVEELNSEKKPQEPVLEEQPIIESRAELKSVVETVETKPVEPPKPETSAVELVEKSLEPELDSVSSKMDLPPQLPVNSQLVAHAEMTNHLEPAVEPKAPLEQISDKPEPIEKIAETLSDDKDDQKKESNKRQGEIVAAEDLPPVKTKPPSAESAEKVLETLMIAEMSKTDDSKGGEPTDPAIALVEPEAVESDSDGVDNDDAFGAPEEDPLALEEDKSDGCQMKIRVKPVSELVYSNEWKMDSEQKPVEEVEEPPVISRPSTRSSRKRRSSGQEDEQKSDDVQSVEEVEAPGGKKMKLRGKKTLDHKLKKTVEESRVVTISSEDEVSKATEIPVETIDDNENEKKEGDDDVMIIQCNDNKIKRGRPRGRKRRGKGFSKIKSKSVPKPAVEGENKEKSGDKEVTAENVEESVDSHDTSREEKKGEKKRKKRKMLLGLEIDTTAVENELGDPNDPPVRQSRRIAQLKIQEQKRIEQETIEKQKEMGSKDKKKRKKKADTTEEEEDAEEEEEVVADQEKGKSKKKRKRRKKKKDAAKFNPANAWKSSSGSSSTDENANAEDDEDEDDLEESDGSVLFKSDHEFSPESDLEKDDEAAEPMRRARTAQKSEDLEEADDEYACQKCGKADHPEWILLCDKCDQGWHCSCLRPALMLIPEGDWFCPPCQHNSLIMRLQARLKSYDTLVKKHENEILRKKRLVHVGISMENIIQKKEQSTRSRTNSGDDDGSDEDSDDSHDGEDDGSSSSSDSSSGTSTSSDESEPVYQLRERRCANTYKFNEYDDMINAAIQDEVEAVQGAGNQGRGKDISTIVNAEKEESQAEEMKIQKSDDNEDPEEKAEKESDEDYEEEKDEDEEEESHRAVLNRKLLSRKKHRKLNSLDISSEEDDHYSDEDFKGTSEEEEEDFEDAGSSEDSSIGGKRGKRGDRAVRRSTRARTRRYDEDFINDDSEESDRPKRKKSKSQWNESEESEDSEASWKQKKKRSKTVPAPRSRTVSTKSKSKKKKKRKRIIESEQSDNDEEEDMKASMDADERQSFVRTSVVDNVPAVAEAPAPLIQPTPDQIIQDPQVPVPQPPMPELYVQLQPIQQAPSMDPVQSVNPPMATGGQVGTELSQQVIPQTEPQVPVPAMPAAENINVDPTGTNLPLSDEFTKKRKKEYKKKSPAIRRKVIYGGLPDDNPTQEEETPGRRTRGRKVNYQLLASDSDEELKKALKKTEESEDEFVMHENQAGNDGEDKDSDSGDDTYSPQKGSVSQKKLKKLKKSRSPSGKRRSFEDDGTPKVRKKPGPKPGSKNKPRPQQRLSLTPILNDDDMLKTMDIEGIDDAVRNSGMAPGSGEGSLAGLAELDDEQLEQMMMEDEEYGRRQLEIAAIEIQKKKKKEEREAKKMEKARLKALEILAAEQNMTSQEGCDGEVPKKKKRGRRSKAEILAEQMRRDGTTNPTIMPAEMSNPPIMEPVAPVVPTTPMIPMSPMTNEAALFHPDGTPFKPKRRGRGKGKKTLALEAARAAEAAAKGGDMSMMGMGTDSNPDDLPIMPTPGGSSTSGSAPSTPPSNQSTGYPNIPPPNQQSPVITRMLQSQPVAPPGVTQPFAAAAAAMGHKYFGTNASPGPMIGSPRPPGYDMQPRGRIPSPYRQPGQQMPPHFAVRPGTPPMRMRMPGTPMYHTTHHMDPSPSGGGPISINNRDSRSPIGMMPKGGPTPPPPPYVRAGPPLARFPDTPQLTARHQMPPFANASAHAMQQPSPPPSRPPGNFSPYHPPPPPNYHYGAYPPPPPMAAADDAAAYQGSPYPADHFSATGDNQVPPPPIQAPPPPQPPGPGAPHPVGPPEHGEEGSGEFGGLVSYFSSQREDDLES